MLRNAAINTVEENRATLHRYIGTNSKSRRTPDLSVAGLSAHAPFETPRGKDRVGLGKRMRTRVITNAH